MNEMNIKQKNIFSEDVEIPDIVRQKTAFALACIKREAAQCGSKENEMTRETKRRIFKSWTGAAAAIAAIALVGGGVAFAAINHFWSDGIQEVLEIDEKQLQTLEEQGNIQMLDSVEPVTVQGVAVRPLELVADRFSARVTFFVSGVDESIVSGKELLFDTFRTEIADGGFSGADGRFYDRSIIDENGIQGFEYVINLYSRSSSLTGTLLGKNLHVEMCNLSRIVSKAEAGDVLAKGTWAFDIPLPESDPSAIIEDISYPLSGTVYTVDQIMLSPLSMQVIYQVNGDVEIGREDNDVPIIHGVRLKDGTMLDVSSELESGYQALDISPGTFLYDDPEQAASDEIVRLHPECAIAAVRFNQVLDPAEVAEVILQPWDETFAIGGLVEETEYWEIPID